MICILHCMAFTQSQSIFCQHIFSLLYPLLSSPPFFHLIIHILLSVTVNFYLFSLFVHLFTCNTFNSETIYKWWEIISFNVSIESMYVCIMFNFLLSLCFPLKLLFSNSAQAISNYHQYQPPNLQGFGIKKLKITFPYDHLKGRNKFYGNNKSLWLFLSSGMDRTGHCFLRPEVYYCKTFLLVLVITYFSRQWSNSIHTNPFTF